ncbi:MAG: hypothetical protein WD055_01965 [Candidatus Dependentiae bacterium]
MQTCKAYMLVTLCAITPLSYTHEIPNINFGNVAEKLEYDLATWKTRHNAVSAVEKWSIIGSTLSIAALFGAVAVNPEFRYKYEHSIAAPIPGSINISGDLSCFFVTIFFASWATSQYTNAQVNELELAVQEYIKRSERQNK